MMLKKYKLTKVKEAIVGELIKQCHFPKNLACILRLGGINLDI